jgi:uncharacterized membrane protein
MTTQATGSIIVKGTPDQNYKFWADLNNYSKFMRHVKSVERLDDNTSHWVLEGSDGETLEWEAEITRQEDNKRIAWNSKEDPRMAASGQVTFNGLPDNQTEVTVTLQYSPTSQAGEAANALVKNLDQDLTEDLHNFKAIVEDMPGRVTR